MSGLEPIAALGLACNILQVVGVGLKTVQIAKQVYADGELDPSLTDSATVLDTLCRHIRSARSPAATAPPTRCPKTQEEQLFELAQKCQDVARDLREEVAFLNGQGSKTKLVATLRIAAKTTWRNRRLEKLSQKLKDVERLLQTGLLSRIYEQSVKTNNELSTLDASLRAFIHEYRNGHASAIDLVKHTMAENKKSEATVMSHITQTSQQSEASLKGYIGSAIRKLDKKDQDEAKCGRLLRSLKFERMNERRNQVGSSHTNTLSWVLQDGSDSNGPQDMRAPHHTESGNTWNSFSDWLRSTETVYWISGKPGSGKTTLMKYLLGQDKTMEFLDLWKPNALIVSHFFWRPGTSMQQSIRGLLCSLLHQLLLGEPAASDEVFRINRDASNKDTETDWSYEELRNTFHHLLSRCSRPIAMFLDGLDEVLPQDGVLKLLETVEEVKDRQSGKIKLCLGSRREPLLLKSLGVYPRLRLEQLNLADLRQYAEDHVVIPDDYYIIIPDDYYIPLDGRWSPTQFKTWLVDSLTSRAEGVFLWLCLTATTIQKALNEGESVQDIRHRVGSLPRDLSDLFADMWARANNDGVHFQKRAASFLQLALVGIDNIYPLNPFVMMVATTPEMPRLLLEPSQRQHISVSSLVEACKATIRETASRCAGLLVLPSLKEVDEVKDTCLFPWHGEEYNLLLPYVSNSPVYFFLHRTARDFLTDTEDGKRILKESNFTEAHATIKLLEARLATHRLFRSPVHCTDVNSDSFCFNIRHNYLGDILYYMMLTSKTKDFGEFERSEITQLLLVCEQLFHDGYLSSSIMVPRAALEYDREPRTAGRYTSYESTVKFQHEFLLWAASGADANPDIWYHLCPMIEGRNLDKGTILQLLIHSCSFSNLFRSSSEAMESRSKMTHALLRRLGSSCLVGLHRRSGTFNTSPWVATFETPFKALIMSLWTTAISFNTEPNHARKLLELVLSFVAQGANLKEEVHVAIELDGDRIRILPLNPFEWTGLKETRTRSSSCGTGHAFLVVSYPATAVLTHILNLWKLTDHLGFEWVPKVPEKGIPVAIVGLNMSFVLGSDWMFEMEEIYPLEPETEVAGTFQHLISLAEDGLRGPILQNSSSFYATGAVLASVTASQEIHEKLEGAFEFLRSGNVPLAERRRAVRMRLGIQTPLEEPEWRAENENSVRYKAT